MVGDGEPGTGSFHGGEEYTVFTYPGGCLSQTLLEGRRRSTAHRSDMHRMRS